MTQNVVLCIFCALLHRYSSFSFCSILLFIAWNGRDLNLNACNVVMMMTTNELAKTQNASTFQTEFKSFITMRL